MPTSIFELLLNVSEHGAKAGVEHLAWKAKQGQGPQGLPAIPTLDEALGKRMGVVPDLDAAMAKRFGVAVPAAAVANQELPQAAPRNVPKNMPAAPSYAQEFGMKQDASPIACWGCTVRHMSAMVGAAEYGLEGRMAPAEASATIRGEAEAWLTYDLTPEKVANTSPGRRQPILDAVPHVKRALAELPAGPGAAPLAWDTAVEAFRFANSSGGNPSPMEQGERDLRVEDVMEHVSLLDTLPLPAAANPHLSAVRLARQHLGEAGGPTRATPETIAELRDSLRGLAVAITPEPTQEQLRRAHEHLLMARKTFNGGALTALKARAATPDRPPTVAVAQEVLATPRTATVFDRWDEFAKRIGVPVRFRDLGPDYLGLFQPEVPAHGAILLGSAAQSKDALATETLAHELVHAGLHSLTTDIYKSAGHQPQEQEAELASAAAVASLGLPVETWRGEAIRHEVPDWPKLHKQVGEPMARRVEWASRVLVLAGEGDQDSAYTLWRQGPPR